MVLFDFSFMLFFLYLFIFKQFLHILSFRTKWKFFNKNQHVELNILMLDAFLQSEDMPILRLDYLHVRSIYKNVFHKRLQL